MYARVLQTDNHVESTFCLLLLLLLLLFIIVVISIVAIMIITIITTIITIITAVITIFITAIVIIIVTTIITIINISIIIIIVIIIITIIINISLIKCLLGEKILLFIFNPCISLQLICPCPNFYFILIYLFVFFTCNKSLIIFILSLDPFLVNFLVLCPPGNAGGLLVSWCFQGA